MNNRLLTLLFSVLCLLGLTSLGYGQNPALANINYWDNGTGDPELPLGCPCTEGEPYPDGVQYCLYWDNNANGPDPSDQQPIGDGNPEYGHSNWSCLAMNGDEFNGTPGYFWTSPTLVITIPPTAPDTALYYLRINSGGCCWTSRVFYIGPGLQEFDMLFSEWTCEDDSCSLVGDPPPAPTNVVASDGINCLQVDITWEHTGEDVSSFGIYDEDGFILSTPQSARSARVNVDDDQVHTFEVRASNAYGETPGNPDAGSSYLLHFADGPEGNVYGCELSGDPFTVAFSLPETCPSRVTLHVLGPAGNILYPAFEVDS